MIASIFFIVEKNSLPNFWSVRLFLKIVDFPQSLNSITIQLDLLVFIVFFFQNISHMSSLANYFLWIFFEIFFSSENFSFGIFCDLFFQEKFKKKFFTFKNFLWANKEMKNFRITPKAQWYRRINSFMKARVRLLLLINLYFAIHSKQKYLNPLIYKLPSLIITGILGPIYHV